MAIKIGDLDLRPLVNTPCRRVRNFDASSNELIEKCLHVIYENVCLHAAAADRFIFDDRACIASAEMEFYIIAANNCINGRLSEKIAEYLKAEIIAIPFRRAANVRNDELRGYSGKLCRGHTAFSSARHHQADLFDRGDLRVNLADDLSLVDHEESIGERRDLFEFSRDQ